MQAEECSVYLLVQRLWYMVAVMQPLSPYRVPLAATHPACTGSCFAHGDLHLVHWPCSPGTRWTMPAAHMEGLSS